MSLEVGTLFIKFYSVIYSFFFNFISTAKLMQIFSMFSDIVFDFISRSVPPPNSSSFQRKLNQKKSCLLFIHLLTDDDMKRGRKGSEREEKSFLESFLLCICRSMRLCLMNNPHGNREKKHTAKNKCQRKRLFPTINNNSILIKFECFSHN